MIYEVEGGGTAETLYDDVLEGHWSLIDKAFELLQVGFDRALAHGWLPKDMVLVHVNDCCKRLELGGKTEKREDGEYWVGGHLVVEVSWSWTGTTWVVVEEKWTPAIPLSPN